MQLGLHENAATGKADCIALYTSERMHVCMQAVIQDMRVAMSAMHVAFCICARLARQGFDAMYILLHDCLHASIAYVLVITSFIQGLYIYCRVYILIRVGSLLCVFGNMVAVKGL